MGSLSHSIRYGTDQNRFFGSGDWTLLLLLVGYLGGFPLAADPVADALADPQKFVIEAEDFDFDGGKHRAGASVMPYFGGDYSGLAGVPGVDFVRTAVADFSAEYRSGDSPVVPIFEQASESRRDRGTWKVTRNYSLVFTEPGQWFNYTRQIPPGRYRVWIAAASADASPAGIRGRLQRVTGGAGTPTQTVNDLGSVEAPGSGGWDTLAFVPMLNSIGDLLQLEVQGVTTFRYAPERGDLDFILLESVIHGDPDTRLRAEFGADGRVVLSIERGLPRPTQLQGAVGLNAAGTEWKSLPWDFLAPLVIPEDSPYRFFRLLMD
ncbi:MAG: hypothetical protein U1G08_06095 [Verrucomicrobiota bacterium]